MKSCQTGFTGAKSIIKTFIDSSKSLNHLINTRDKVAKVKFKVEGYDKAIVESTASFFARSASHIGAKISGINGEPMKITRWSVLSSPHVHKTAWTQFERRTHTHNINIETIPKQLVRPLLWYLQQHLPPDIKFQCSITENILVDDSKI